MIPDEPRYVSLNEVSEDFKLKKESLYYYFHLLGIKPKRWKGNRCSFITEKERERIRVLRTEPWKSESAAQMVAQPPAAHARIRKAEKESENP